MNKVELGAALTMFAAFGCQFDDRCGKDDLVYARGLCSAPSVDAGPPPPPVDSGARDSDSGGAPSPCLGACELIGRCISENSEAAAFLANELTAIGFVGTDRAGCVTFCDAHSSGKGDQGVLACLDMKQQTALCDQSMLAGSLPGVQGLDTCCMGHADSEYCVAVCTVLSKNAAAYGFVPNCKGIVP